LYPVELVYDDADEDDVVLPSVTIDAAGQDITSIRVEKVPDYDTFLGDDTPGWIGNAFEFSINGQFENGTISFEYDPSAIEYDADDFEPRIYYFNEETQLLEELPDQTIDGNVITASVEHFSGYILLDRITHNKAWEYDAYKAQLYVWADLLESGQLIAAGEDASFALRDGNVWAWGSGGDGRLGLGSTASVAAPQKIQSLNSIVSVSARNNTTAALTSGGNIYVWGGDASKYTSYSGNNHTPRLAAGISGVKSVAVGTNSALALKNDGTVWRLGKPASQISGLSDIVYIAAGNDANFAVDSDGVLYSWGGPAATCGTGNPSASPQQVMTGVKSVAVDHQHVLALKNNGTVYTWGHNSDGQMGLVNSNGQKMGSLLPVQIPGLSGITQVSARGDTSLALGADGTVYGFGLGTRLGFSANVLTPTVMPGLDHIVMVASAIHHSLFLREDGHLYGIGYKKGINGGSDYANAPTFIAMRMIGGDTDGDGIPDYYENNGFLCGNGSRIFTDPQDPDTDGDGLYDGAEATFNANHAAGGWYYLLQSNPTLADTDYDGIDDPDDTYRMYNAFSGTAWANDLSFDVDFKVDYRAFFAHNDKYSKDLSVLGSLYATLNFA
jgi:alpha-tubulin suppressor-like RCC1 family protein